MIEFNTFLKKCFLPALFLSSFSGQAQNLLVNASAENTLGTEWTVVRAAPTCYTSTPWRIAGNQNGFPTAQHGSYFFFPGCRVSADPVGTAYEIYQDVSLNIYDWAVDAGMYTINFSGYMQSFTQTPPDETQIIVEFRNAANTGVLASFNSGTYTSQGSWVQYTHTATPPVGTRYIRVRLIGTAQNGTSVDSYFDNLSLTGPTVLPVELLSFTATASDNKVALTWQTTHEVNNKGFHIQHSVNGNTWNTIGFVPATTTGSAVNNYHFTNHHPFTGTNFYRLLQEDTDGKTKASATRQLTVGTSGKPALYPNPVKETLHLSGIGAGAAVELFNTEGKRIGQYHRQYTINTSRLVPGMYYLKVQTGDQATLLKFIRQ